MEDRLVFDSRYLTGVEQIDLEHQELFELASEIYDSLSLDVIVPMREIRPAINKLIENTGAHFAHEEMLMESSGYPDLQQHRAIHADLLSQIRDFEARTERTEQLTPVDVYQFLCSWLGDHIQSSDRVFGEFMSHRTPSA